MGSVVLADLDRDGLLAAVPEADVLWIRLRHQIDAEVLAVARRLKVIASPTTGLDHVDVEEAERRGIRLLSLHGEREFLKHIHATAEHTVGLILALVRDLPGAIVHVRAGGWNRDLFRGTQLYGKTAGVVGYGRLGGIAADYLKAFGMRMLVSDPSAEVASLAPGLNLVPLSDLLREADIVTLHVDLRKETRGFFGRREFAAMKEGSWLINTSRGELVDETALLEALCSGRLAGAAVDVLSGERSTGMGSHPLVVYACTHDNLIITPHIGGCTAESMEASEVFLAGKLRDMFLSNRTLAAGS